MKTVFPVHRFPVASGFKRILLSATVCISDEALYAVVDPFDDFECIGFVKNSSLLFIKNESSSFLIIYEANRKNFFFVDFCTSMDKIRASFLRNNHAAENTCTRNRCSKHQKSHLTFLFRERNVLFITVGKHLWFPGNSEIHSPITTPEITYVMALS